ncbi:hypothetical protein LVJ94_49240 [Pendulispora rubella]|uniref:Uncharacterized protein n=1 Tax=Pendulispora rubella TaxID=2741070 RepID=A0ABZ2L1Q3_9BACT
MSTWLRFHRVRTGSFRDGRDKLLVDFTDDTNQPAGDWCPRWFDVEKIVLAAVEVEQTNDGDYVEMLRKVEDRLARRLPKLAVARHRALMHAYNPPHIEAEILDKDRPGWGPRIRLRLTCPVPQQILDLIIENGALVHLIVREDRLTDVRAQVSGDEVSLAAIAAENVFFANGQLFSRKPF